MLCTGKDLARWRSLFSGRGSRVYLLKRSCPTLRSVLYIEYFLLLFTVLLLKLKYEFWVGSGAEAVDHLLYSKRICLQRGKSSSLTERSPIYNKNIVLHFMIFMGKLESLWNGSSRCFALLLFNRILKGSVNFSDFKETPVVFLLGTSFCMTLALFLHYI